MRLPRNFLNSKQLKSSVWVTFMLLLNNNISSLHYKQITTADGYQTKTIQLLMDKYETSKWLKNIIRGRKLQWGWTNPNKFLSRNSSQIALIIV